MHPRPFASVLLSLLCFVFSAVGFYGYAACAQAPANKPAAVSCSVRRSAATEGDIAYSHAKWDDAIGLYRAESNATSEEGERIHNALIRTEIRAGKLPDAESDAKAWIASSPKDAWALASLGEVQFRNGDIDAAGEALRSAAAGNFCNAQVHADYARYLSFTGFNASAQSQLGIAHKLDPVDDEIASNWLQSLPRSARVAAIAAYLQRTSFLTDKERKSWENERDALSHPPEFPCTLSSSLASTSMPFYAIRNGVQSNGQQSRVLWGLAVGFNGKERRLEIDTGAHGLLLTRPAAAALGLEIEAHSNVYGIGDEGMKATSIGKVKDLKIGGLEFHNCAVEVLEKGSEVMQGQDGLIGGDVFQNFLVTLDFPGRKLKLDPLPVKLGAPASAQSESASTGVEVSEATAHDRYVDPSMASWTKVFRLGHELVLPVRLNGGPVRLFIVDTGASLSLVSPTAARQVASVDKGSPVEVLGISGEVQHLYETGPLNLDFAGLRQPTPGLIASDMTMQSNADGVELSGFLGAPALHQLTVRIDYRDQLMQFTYEAGRVAHCVPGVTIDDCY